MKESIIDKYELVRGTNWVSQFGGTDTVLPDWHSLPYVSEKTRRALRDTEHLAEFIEEFRQTGNLERLNDFRMLLTVILEDVDSGCWWAVAEGAR